MKRSLVTALLPVALLGGTCSAAQAGGFGIGLNIGLTFTGSGSGSCDNGGYSGCKGCLPPPGWSGCYPRPVMYGGMSASPPCQDSYQQPTYAYPSFQGNYGYYDQGYAWMHAPAQVPATPGISTIPPPGPSPDTPK